MKYHLLLFAILLICIQPVFAQEGMEADETEEALDELDAARKDLLKSEQAKNISMLLGLGLWDRIPTLLEEGVPELDEKAIAQADYFIHINEFEKAEKILDSVLLRSPDDCQAKMLRARLYIESWELEKAIPILESCTSEEPECVYWLGKILLYQKRYKDALGVALQMKKVYPEYGKMHLLEGEAHFWLRNMPEAEEALRGALYYSPYDADARFYYGYAIWRRVDATQLPNMAAQWKLALEIDPLHYLTHWHWGNGHTQLTYSDYLDPKEEEILKALEPVEALISQNKIKDALTLLDEVQPKYSRSVLPAMLAGSAMYMDYDRGRDRLDDAERIFKIILAQKANYGPAHNALAAVIKQKRIGYLAATDSLEKITDNTEIAPQDMKAFLELFPDMAYYPGERVQKMIWNQLHTSKVYFPFLNKLGRKFVIPPLHIDLARAMENPYFRGNTTFDNRQWMDIRGVGSGATAIEYVERGAHLERNVTLHEYVHLFHMTVFTDQEKRRVRELYANAMENDLTLDYYSANNEHEYLAQTYTAYFAPIKVHPLNHKSVNTRNDLLLKDRELFNFLDSLVRRQRAYLNGDEQAMASNWAAVYTSLAESGLRMGFAADNTFARLDTALQWDENYLPAYLALAQAHKVKGNTEQAKKALEKAIAINANYAPIYVAMADLVGADEKEALYLKAYGLEKDFSERADIQRVLREFYLSQAKYKEALAIAEEYIAEVPTFSTYLRDRKREAQAFAYSLRAELGDTGEALAFFKEQTAQRPQDYRLRLRYVNALSHAEEFSEATEVLLPAYELLRAAGSKNRNMAINLAYNYVKMGDFSNAFSMINESRSAGRVNDISMYHELLILLRQFDQAAQDIASWEPYSVRDQAKKAFLEGLFWEEKGKAKVAMGYYADALKLDPLQTQAAKRLMDLYEAKKKANKVKEVKAQLQAELKKVLE